jgi:hypothetical protein
MFPWYSSAMLAFESNHVVGLRLMKLTRGGGDASHEAHLMISEKIAAAFDAAENAAQTYHCRSLSRTPHRQCDPPRRLVPRFAII